MCCKHFKETIKYYDWFLLEQDNGEKVYVMPVFPNSRVRIQYCPSCGTKIRDIRIPENDMNEIIYGTK